jgi:hypothetical protein
VEHLQQLVEPDGGGISLDLGHARLLDANALPDLSLREPARLSQGLDVHRKLVRRADGEDVGAHTDIVFLRYQHIIAFLR